MKFLKKLVKKLFGKDKPEPVKKTASQIIEDASKQNSKESN